MCFFHSTNSPLRSDKSWTRSVSCTLTTFEQSIVRVDAIKTQFMWVCIAGAVTFYNNHKNNEKFFRIFSPITHRGLQNYLMSFSHFRLNPKKLCENKHGKVMKKKSIRTTIKTHAMKLYFVYCPRQAVSAFVWCIKC